MATVNYSVICSIKTTKAVANDNETLLDFNTTIAQRLLPLPPPLSPACHQQI
jgi:hypothetical protein